MDIFGIHLTRDNLDLSLSVFLGLLTFFISLLYRKNVMDSSVGEGKQVYIYNLIKESAFVYLKRQYKVIFLIAAVLFIILFKIFGIFGALSFALGAAASSWSGFFNMDISVNSNVRAVEGAKTEGLSKAFKIAIFGGAAASFYLSAIGILIIIAIKFLPGNFHQNLICLGLGASLVSVFARLGGGIFTKGADVGADLVGKVEKNIPEDDPRNPAVIADNVGDNVGDCAGMSADLMESLIVTIISAIILLGDFKSLVIFGVGVISCLIPILMMEFKKVWSEMNRYFWTSSLLFTVFLGVAKLLGYITFGESLGYFIGVATTGIILKITEYYTSCDFRPVQSIAKASSFGHGTNVISGLSFGFEAVFVSLVIVLTGVALSFANFSSISMTGGIGGVTRAVMGSTALLPAILVLDIFGPISDNAGGIAEMSALPAKIREITDELDGVGNTTKAITKGFAISSAIFSSIVMFYLFNEDLFNQKSIILFEKIGSPVVFCGILWGAILPFAFSSLSLRSVGLAAEGVVQEVRIQFQDPELFAGTKEPDYKKTIEFLTDFSIKGMICSGTLPILFPVIAYFCGFLKDQVTGALLLSTCLIGITISSSLLGILMTVAGGAWDNAKKFIETGNFGGKGTDVHKAAVTGDTVGDPFKDTTGPSLNSVTKLASLVGILLLYI